MRKSARFMTSSHQGGGEYTSVAMLNQANGGTLSTKAKIAQNENGVSVQILTDRFPFIARLTKPARRFGNLGSFLAWVARRRS